MKIGIMQPYMFPYIGYFQLMKAVDKYVIYDDVQFIKGGWINRNNVLISGKKNLFTIRLDSTSPNKLINEIEIIDDFIKFHKMLDMIYSKAPFKTAVCELIDKICSFENKNLPRFIGNSFTEILLYLNINTDLVYSSDLKKDNELRGQDKVIAICEEIGATTYINAVGGQELYNREDFMQHHIELKFLAAGPVTYRQFKNEFVPALSIIDVMMFNSPEQVKDLLDNYELR